MWRSSLAGNSGDTEIEHPDIIHCYAGESRHPSRHVKDNELLESVTYPCYEYVRMKLTVERTRQ